MIKTKLYLYDSSKENYKGEDYSNFILQGDYYTEDITEELDTSEMTLCGLPKREEFIPETKFILEKYNVKNITLENQTFEQEELVYTYHIVVEQDTVSQPMLSSNNYFDHHISFLEPSVVAQKRLVDNISITYKLKNVNLNTVPNFNINEETKTNNQPSNYSPDENFGVYSTGFLGYYSNRVFGKYFELDGKIEMLRDNSQIGSVKLYQNFNNYADSNYFARFKIPKIKIMFGSQNSKNFSYIGDASLHYTIQEFNINNYLQPTNTWEGDIISNSNLQANGTVNYAVELDNIPNTSYNKREWLPESLEWWMAGKRIGRTNVRKYTQTSADTPTYFTKSIQIQNNKKYIIKVSLKEFSDRFSVGAGWGLGELNYITSVTTLPIKYFQYQKGALDNPSITTISCPENQVIMSSTFQTYSTDTTKILLQSANPYNALSLLQKAIVNSHFVEKEPNIFIGDINNMKLPFYIDENYVEELERTQIIEMFYSQKNLWEFLIEVGKYLHAIPRIEFGVDDKFKITFDKLGDTNQKSNKCTTINIMNFKNVSDYVSACTSYITNMVQLGGEMDEWVAPKTNSEEALVYNDTCSINVSNPIIELLKVEVKCVSGNYNFAQINQVADMTQYIYENSVYKVLSVSFTDVPNKGVSLYYDLGTNTIVGCNYKNPTVNSGDPQNDYAIKKIIYCAFFGGYPNDFATANKWRNIKVNDFIFHVIYRTKDNIRQNQTRPDLRKYLVNSKYDNVPQHNQFNNQTDIVVDSIKFGNNLYGKLIRTGNTNYKIVEYTNDLTKLKHRGELYRIDNDLYYVAKVKHTFFCSHIISEIDYSKDYNQLSQIIGIPSEPRFYEISERNTIKREISISDYLLLTDDENKLSQTPELLKNVEHASKLMFGGTDANFAKYVITTFKGDKDTSKTDIVQGSNNFYQDILSPLNAYASENTLTYEWKMADNLSAGDAVDRSGYTGDVNVSDNAYKSLKAVQYTDLFGKAPLMDFYLLKDLPALSGQEILNKPNSPFRTRITGRDEIENSKPFIGGAELKSLIIATNVSNLNDTDYNGRGIGILKDCREIISINYNEELITNSDTFVISPYLFSPNKNNVRIVLLNKEVNKLSSGFIDNSSIIHPFDLENKQVNSKYFNFTPTTSSNLTRVALQLSQIFANVNQKHFGDMNGNDIDGFERVKGIAVIYDFVEENASGNNSEFIPYKTKFVVAKNIPNLESFLGKEKALKNWYLGTPNKENLFIHKQ